MNLYVRLVSYCSFVNYIARMKAQLGNIACWTPIAQEAAGNRPLKRKYLALVTVYKPVTQESSCFCLRAQHSRWSILINMSNSNRLSQTFCVTRPAEILTGVITPSPGKLKYSSIRGGFQPLGVLLLLLPANITTFNRWVSLFRIIYHTLFTGIFSIIQVYYTHTIIQVNFFELNPYYSRNFAKTAYQ